MKVHDRLNVIPLPLKERGQDRQDERQSPGGGARPPELVQSVREQMTHFENAIRMTEEVRSGIDESACAAASALFRFEQALANLKLSLENQRSAAARIDSAGRAGDTAALLKAQILRAGDLALSSHAGDLLNPGYSLFDPGDFASAR